MIQVTVYTSSPGGRLHFLGRQILSALSGVIIFSVKHNQSLLSLPLYKLQGPTTPLPPRKPTPFQSILAGEVTYCWLAAESSGVAQASGQQWATWHKRKLNGCWLLWLRWCKIWHLGVCLTKILNIVNYRIAINFCCNSSKMWFKSQITSTTIIPCHNGPCFWDTVMPEQKMWQSW